MLKKILNYFTKFEIALWLSSITAIAASFLIFDRTGWLKLAASLIGITALIFNAKGNPVGQILIIIFSVLYGIISYSFAYYGEMITYMGMSAPMALLAFISWIRNPYNGNRSEVKVNRIKRGEVVFMLLLTVAVTAAFYFILEKFGTANIVPSTISVTTSFIAVYLTFRRSEFYALAYSANDLILIVLWIMAAMSDISYLSVIICFAMFLINDLYGFISWRKMRKRQTASDKQNT
ncbi:MAG: nicotinamide riboside transporter PnuC [Oscillospiraceae bacterium]|nr:nicotinamide riboside transporter PnuC [Oscillospiraceae bacterium]